MPFSLIHCTARYNKIFGSYNNNNKSIMCMFFSYCGFLHFFRYWNLMCMFGWYGDPNKQPPIKKKLFFIDLLPVIHFLSTLLMLMMMMVPDQFKVEFFFLRLIMNKERMRFIINQVLIFCTMMMIMIINQKFGFFFSSYFIGFDLHMNWMN